MKKVLLGYKFRHEGFEDIENEFEFTYPESEYFRKEELLEMLADYDVFVPSFKYLTDRELIDRGSKLKLIANFGVGYNNIDTEYAARKGITVTNTPNAVLEPTAELCFALLNATARRIAFYDRHLRISQGLGWGLYDNPGVGLYGKTLGIYGMGRIGQAVARRAIASGMNIIYHNRHALPKDIEEKYSARYVSFDELLRNSDFISLNAPATPETRHLINREQLQKMKPSAILINTARGSLVDEEALVEALSNNTILAAGLDVYENEPKIRPEFKMLENVVLLPHTGTQTIDARIAMQREVAQNISAFFSGGIISKVN
ncbi:dihydrofolate reductase [Dysgonomonas sp. 216]|uniref:NAD(P)-dependent oxidoreductase n=1 Tax=Dysgonomonas sp. 216 TaxID=2302934 RepID=UPI0013D5BD10|nr:NAD(P)-dependent oxidoreductase [Dysgonomonas sp. 216]NDW18025.1 dihydrofolate reductase [Dysgonomonas sp. 216]